MKRTLLIIFPAIFASFCQLSGSNADNVDNEHLTDWKTSDKLGLPSAREESGAPEGIRTPNLPRVPIELHDPSCYGRLQFGKLSAAFGVGVASVKMPLGLGFPAKVIQESAPLLLRVRGFSRNSGRFTISKRVRGLLKTAINFSAVSPNFSTGVCA